jgi:hypothetical protein
MFISQMLKENGSLIKVMKSSDLICIFDNQINEKFVGISSSISDLMWKSISTSMLNPTLYSFQDSVGHAVNNFIWRAIQNSSKILIHNLNAKCSYTMGSKE